MTQMTRYNLPDAFDKADFLKQLAESYPLQREREVRDQAVFYDTFDWRLYEKGLLLLHQDETLALAPLKDEHLPLCVCTVAETPLFAEDLPEGELRNRLTPIIEMRALLKLFEKRSRLRTLRVLDEAQKTVAYLALETALLSGAGNKRHSHTVLWLRPLRGYEAQAESLHNFLSESGCRPAGESWPEIAAPVTERAPGDYSTKLRVPLEAQQPSGEAAKTILRVLLSAMRANEEGIRKDIDTEFLHDFRVAVRRTRSALGQLKGVFPVAETQRFRKDFSYLGKLSNRLRDLDVYLLHEKEYQNLLPEALRGGIDPLFDYLRVERRKEQRKMARALRSPRYLQILQDWEAFLNAPAENSPSAPNAGVPTGELAGARIYKRFRAVLKAGRGISGASPDSELHALRLECKKLRYLLEFFSSLYPEQEIQRLVKQLKGLQDNLGRFQDLFVQQGTLLSWVERFSAAAGEGEKTVIAIGSLVGSLEAEKRQVRSAFPGIFAKFASGGNKKLFKKLFAPPEPAVAAPDRKGF
ncbi:MAG: CHAD domain-containing protein [Calditrichaceae bacterium]|nr:CHAD domain-containing protein [Calditrichia bacterium]NUQ42534.1 CHAD domain-containing protein [Calditrichaceae bacterium]